MRELIIRFEVSDQQAAVFARRDVLVTPVSDCEAGQLAVVLQDLADTCQLNWQSLSTLKQVLDSKGAEPVDIAKTLDMLMEPNRLAVGQIDYVRALLERSARVGRTQEGKETLQ